MGYVEFGQRLLFSQGVDNAAELLARKAVADTQLAAETAVRAAENRMGDLLGRDALATDIGKVNAPKLLVDGARAFPAMMKAVAGAKREILLETFDFANDSTGRQLAYLLSQKAREGVAVKVIVDTLGSRVARSKDPALDVLRKMSDAGVEVRLHNPKVLTLKEGLPVSHRKSLVIDGKVFFTGGMNIGDLYAKKWHDTLMRLEGDPVRQAMSAFNTNWVKAGGVPVVVPPVPKSGRGRSPVSAEVVFNDPQAKKFKLTAKVMRLLRGAKEQIRVLVPYLSDPEFMGELKKAAARGVKVHVAIPGVSDEGVFTDFNKWSAHDLLEHGVEVRWYIGKPSDHLASAHFSHTKALMVDSDTVVFGSANADHRTFAGNHEMSVVVKDRATAQDALKQLFQPDWEAARPAKLSDYDALGLWTRFKIALYRLFGRFL